MVTTGPSTGIMSLPRGVRTSSIRNLLILFFRSADMCVAPSHYPFSPPLENHFNFDCFTSNSGTLTIKWAFGPILHPQPAFYRSRV